MACPVFFNVENEQESFRSYHFTQKEKMGEKGLLFLGPN